MHTFIHDICVCLQVPTGKSLKLTSSPKRIRVTSPSPSMTLSGPCSGNWWVYLCVSVCVVVCVCMCSLVLSGSPTPTFLIFMLKDVPLTGISQAGFHVWLESETDDREMGGIVEEERASERGGEGGCPCWTETDVRDWWGSEQHWHTTGLQQQDMLIHSAESCSSCLDDTCTLCLRRPKGAKWQDAWV